MQFKLAALSTLALAALAVATPTKRNDAPQDQCNTGELQCCQSVQVASSKQASLLLGLFNVATSTVQGLVGINCSPVSVFGVGGNSCTAQPVCCTDNSFDGVIVIGCSPININA